MRAVVVKDWIVKKMDLDGYDGIKQALNDGWLEAVKVANDVTAYIDEEGKMKELPYNQKAMEVLTRLINQVPFGGQDIIVGPMVLVGFNPETGDDIDVPQWVLTKLGLFS